MPSIKPYFVAVCQAEIVAVRSGGIAKFRENVQKNLERFCGLIDYCCAGNLALDPVWSTAGPVKLLTFGEFAITGPYMPAAPGEKRFTNQDVLKYSAIRIPGEETEVLARKAKQYGVYIAAANHELDPAWPEFHFNTGFIINPEGKIILKYPKTLTNNLVGIACNAHDVMDRWLNPITKKFDPFPVVDTAIGRLGIMICADLWAPEIPRIYSMKGADIVLHLASGNTHSAGGPRPIGVHEAVKRARAAENAVYLVNSNWGPETGAIYPRSNIAGHSAIIDYMGAELAKSEDCTETIVRAKIDIEARREYSQKYGQNRLSMMRTELYQPYYRRTIYPPNVFLEGGPFAGTLDARQKAVYTQAMANLKGCEDFYSEKDV